MSRIAAAFAFGTAGAAFLIYYAAWAMTWADPITDWAPITALVLTFAPFGGLFAAIGQSSR